MTKATASGSSPFTWKIGAEGPPDTIELLVHEDGVYVPELDRLYKNQVRHDPSDLDAARRFAAQNDRIRLGVFYADDSRPRYDELRRVAPLTASAKLDLLNQELNRHAV